jgi:predicted RNase H-like nuclease (RuvC/YqgF family)
MDLNDILGQSVTGAIAAFIGWLVGRRKEQAEITTTELDQTTKAIEIWRQMAQEMSDKVKDLSDKIDILTAEVHSLKSENSNLRIKLGINDENPAPKPKRSRSDQTI